MIVAVVAAVALQAAVALALAAVLHRLRRRRLAPQEQVHYDRMAAGYRRVTGQDPDELYQQELVRAAARKRRMVDQLMADLQQPPKEARYVNVEGLREAMREAGRYRRPS